MAVNLERHFNFSEIQHLKHNIERSERLHQAQAEHLCFVLRVERYIADPTFQSLVKSKHATNTSYDVYDLVITDGKFKLKCVLWTALNAFISKGRVVAGSVIKLTKCTLLYDETDLNGFNFVLIEDLTVDGTDINFSVNEERIPWSPDACTREQKQVPLASSRGCYVSLWSSFETYGEVWEQTVPDSQSVSDTTVLDCYTLKELSRLGRSIKASSIPPVIVRVLTRSRLRQYAKPQKAEKWPYQISMVIGDRSGSCTAVVWNSLCTKFNKNIQEGSVLLLENYSVKPHFSVYTYANQTKVIKGSHYDIDLNLNPYNPECKVTIIHASAVESCWQLPSLEYELIDRKQLGRLPDNFICDIVGLVIFLGRYERVAPQTTDSLGRRETFWVIRDVELVDPSFVYTGKTFVIKLFRSIQADTLDRLCPGDMLLCSNMRVVHNLTLVSNSRQKRHVYLTCTGETQVTIIQKSRSTLDHPVVNQLITWASSSRGSAVVRAATYGGYFSYPPLPKDLQLYKQLWPENRAMQITQSDQWESVLQSLSYRESRNLIVQADIVRICHHSLKYVHYRRTSEPKMLVDMEFREEVKFQHPDYMSDNGTVLGSTELYSESLPCKFSPHGREHILSQATFPPSVYSSGLRRAQGASPALAIKPSFSYESVTLMGLNHPVMLHTVFLHSELSLHSRFINVISNNARSRAQSHGNEDSASWRCLCHIDLHQLDTGRTEIILNMAYLLT
ncbi:RPA-related protein RADX-like [Liolophura sinensis]|uniref:RPA-related protein RADX-like n=1 Tax=Liolophura sinensis TaxID=3198878 RepID=UPI0031587E48